MKIHKKVRIGLALLIALLPLSVLVPQQALAAGPSLVFSSGHAFIIVSEGGNSAKFAEGATGGGTAPVKYGNPITTVSGSGCTGSITVPASTIQANKGPATLNGVSCGGQPAVSGTYNIGATGTKPKPPQPTKTKIDWSDVKSAKLNSDGTQLTITFNDGSSAVFYNPDPTSGNNYKPQPASSNFTLDGVQLQWCPNTQATPGTPNTSNKGITLAALSGSSTKGTVDICYTVGGNNINPKPVTITVDTSAYTANADSGSNNPPSCESSGFSLSWILCPIIEGAASAADGIYANLIQPLLITKPIDTTSASGDPTHLYAIWSNFRIYGDIFLVVALLVVIFGESIGGGIIDAYSAKKILPRLLMAVIFINLSIYLVAFAVDLTNILGNGIAALIETPFKLSGTYNIHVGGATGDLGMASLVAAGSALWIGGGEVMMFLMVFLGLPILFTIIAILVTVVLRQGLIILLVLTSPVAFALYCLPNTEKYFRQWWDLLLRTLLVYPLIAIFFALGNILSVTINSTASGISGSFTSILSIFALFAPLFLIPFSFRIAGGALARFHELATTSRKRAHEGILGNANDINSLRNKTKRRLNAKYTAAEARAVNAGKGPHASWANRRRAGLINRLDSRVNERQSRHTREAGEIANMISQTGNDEDHYAAGWFSFQAGQKASSGLTGINPDGSSYHIPEGSVFDRERFFNSKGKEINGDYARAAEHRHAHNPQEAARVLEYPVRKAQTDEDIDNYRRAFAATAARQNLNAGEIIGMHAASTFEHKDKMPELYYSTPSPVTDASGRTTGVKWADVGDDTPEGKKGLYTMSGEMYNTRQGFQLGSVRGESLRAIEGHRARIQQQMDTGAPIDHEDAKFFVETSGIVDQMIQKGIVTREGEAGPEMSASGATPAAQDALKAMVKNSRYGTRNARTIRPDGSEDVSPNEHVIFKQDHINDMISHLQTPDNKTTIRDTAIDYAAVKITDPASPGAPTTKVKVSGDTDRSATTRQA